MIEPLTARERQTAEMRLAGLSNQEIATQLQVKRTTVEQYIHRVYEKSGQLRQQLAESLK